MVESAFLERIVGVPDPEDDCLVIWDLIKANEPPKQIVEGGEYFVLNTSAAPKWTEIPESTLSHRVPTICEIYQSRVTTAVQLECMCCEVCNIVDHRTTSSDTVSVAGFKGEAHH